MKRKSLASYLQWVGGVGGWLASLSISLTMSCQQPACQIHRSPPVLTALQGRRDTTHWIWNTHHDWLMETWKEDLGLLPNVMAKTYQCGSSYHNHKQTQEDTSKTRYHSTSCLEYSNASIEPPTFFQDARLQCSHMGTEVSANVTVYYNWVLFS